MNLFSVKGIMIEPRSGLFDEQRSGLAELRGNENPVRRRYCVSFGDIHMLDHDRYPGVLQDGACPACERLVGGSGENQELIHPSLISADRAPRPKGASRYSFDRGRLRRIPRKPNVPFREPPPKLNGW